jgi:hypothetical protein
MVWDIVTGQRVMTIGNEYDTVLSRDVSPDQTKVLWVAPLGSSRFTLPRTANCFTR